MSDYSWLRDGAIDRELNRSLAFDAVERLRTEGFGALRVPVEFGGAGVTLTELFGHLIDLAAADSNVAHLLRGHFAFVEILLLKPSSPYRDEWLRRVAAGAIVGNAASETTGNTLADISTTLTEVDGRWLLNGKKFYSTGSLYATHIYVAAADGENRVTCVVPTDAAGVTMLDDWDGMGQRLTASGTTLFENVEVEAATISPYSSGLPTHLGGFFQLVLIAVAAGITRGVLADAVDYVRPRTRTFITANAPLPRDDAQVKAVIGELSSAAFTDRAVVLAAASLMDAAAADPEQVDAAEIAAYQAQVHVLGSSAKAATLLFDVGGASTTYRSAAFDRHWRNTRTIATHNPVIYKLRQLGDWELNGVGPNDEWRKLWKVGQTAI